MTNRCETHESALSALLDGELDPGETLSTLDHLAECRSCLTFYRQARALDDLAIETAASSSAIPAPEGIWQRIHDEVSDAETKRNSPFAIRRWPAWTSVAASAALLAAALWVMPHVLGPVSPSRTGEYVEVTVEQNRGDMNEHRFVEITAELLQADRRYHHKMREVLEVVAAHGPTEGSGEYDRVGFRQEDDSSEPERNGENREPGRTDEITTLDDHRL